MNEKIPFRTFAERIAKEAGVSQDDAVIFANQCFELISAALFEGDEVDVPHIGKFTVTPTAEGKSVAFTPDASLAGEVNAPFAIFDSVTLNPEVTEEALETVIAEEETPVAEEAAPAETAAPVEEEKAEEPEAPVEPKEEETVEEVAEVAEVVETPAPSKEPEAAPEETEAVKEETVEAPAAAPVPQPHIEEDVEEYVSHDSDDDGNSSGGFLKGFLIGTVVGLAIGACGIYLAIDYIFPAFQNSESAEVEQIEEIAGEAVATDSTIIEADSLTVEAVAATEQAEETVAAAATPTVVTDTIRSGYIITDMAKKHYGAKDFWVYIYQDNQEAIGNPNRQRIGTVVTIPEASKYGIKAGDQESVKRARVLASEILRKYPS